MDENTLKWMGEKVDTARKIKTEIVQIEHELEMLQKKVYGIKVVGNDGYTLSAIMKGNMTSGEKLRDKIIPEIRRIFEEHKAELQKALEEV